MLRFNRFLGALLATIVFGLSCLAVGQDTADPQAAQPGQDAQATSVQPAQDPDTANEIQQLRAALDQLQQQVSRLTSAVEELQADRTASVKPAPAPRTNGKAPVAGKKTVVITPPPASPEVDERTPLTVLVFQDGHRTEAQNYAIVGQTLWIYTEQDSKKVPLAELDVAATKNANSDRGIVFQVPNTK